MPSRTATKNPRRKRDLVPSNVLTKRAATGSKSAGKTKGGRPRRAPYEPIHVLLDENLRQYLERAWRTHRRKDGSFYSGHSQFIEDLIHEHWRRYG